MKPNDKLTGRRMKGKDMPDIYCIECRGMRENATDRGGLVERPVMPDDDAAKWAWEQVKNDCGLHNLTSGESSTYFGFFMWGWSYRAQLEKQRSEEAQRLGEGR